MLCCKMVLFFQSIGLSIPCFLLQTFVYYFRSSGSNSSNFESFEMGIHMVLQCTIGAILRITEQNHKKFLNHTTLRTTTKNQNYHIICLKSHKPDQDQGSRVVQQLHKTKSRFIMLCGLLTNLATAIVQIVPCHALQNNFINEKPFLQVICYWLFSW